MINASIFVHKDQGNPSPIFLQFWKPVSTENNVTFKLHFQTLVDLTQVTGRYDVSISASKIIYFEILKHLPRSSEISMIAREKKESVLQVSPLLPLGCSMIFSRWGKPPRNIPYFFKTFVDSVRLC